MRFLLDPKIPMHNNAAERLFRALDTGRHNWLFAGSEDSAHNLAVLMGLVATCRLQGIDPQNYLAWAIERRGVPGQQTPEAQRDPSREVARLESAKCNVARSRTAEMPSPA